MIDCAECGKPVDIVGSFLRRDQLCEICGVPVCCVSMCESCRTRLLTKINLIEKRSHLPHWDSSEQLQENSELKIPKSGGQCFHDSEDRASTECATRSKRDFDAHHDHD